MQEKNLIFKREKYQMHTVYFFIFIGKSIALLKPTEGNLFINKINKCVAADFYKNTLYVNQ